MKGREGKRGASMDARRSKCNHGKARRRCSDGDGDGGGAAMLREEKRRGKQWTMWYDATEFHAHTCIRALAKGRRKGRGVLIFILFLISPGYRGIQ